MVEEYKVFSVVGHFLLPMVVGGAKALALPAYLDHVQQGTALLQKTYNSHLSASVVLRKREMIDTPEMQVGGTTLG